VIGVDVVAQYKDVVIAELQKLSPSTLIFVKDRVFTPQQLISEIQANSTYGRAFVLMYLSQHGIVR